MEPITDVCMPLIGTTIQIISLKKTTVSDANGVCIRQSPCRQLYKVAFVILLALKGILNQLQGGKSTQLDSRMEESLGN
jgi:hypothetical protein